MKNLIILFLLFSLSNRLFGQKDSIRIDVNLLKDKIENDEDFVITIKFISNSKIPIYIAANPVFTTSVDEFGTIKLKLEKLEESCFQGLSVDMDPFGAKFKKEIKTMASNDSISYKYDIRNIYSIRKGLYRLKVYFSYSKMQKWLDKESAWIYFTVLNNDHRLPKDSKSF